MTGRGAAVFALQAFVAFCWVCVGLALAQGFWVNAILSGGGALATALWASDVRDRRVES